MSSIKVQTALADFDIEQNPNGSQRTCSIKFWTNTGEIKFIPRGVKCGVNNKNMGGTDTKGIQPVDKHNLPIAHPVPFKWYKVFEYNGQEVIL